MPYLGKQPTPVPLTSSDITDGIVTTTKIADDAVTGAKIENNPTIAGNLAVTGTTTLSSTLGVTGVTTLSDNIVFGTASKGIHLGVTSATTSNLLDDYEEGSWTATFTGSASNPNSSVTATGHYVKVGKFVYVTFAFANINTTGASGEIRITGLPFTPSPGNQMTGDVTMHTLGTITSGASNVCPFVTSTYIAYYGTKSASAWFGIQNNAGTGGYLYCALSYII